MAIWKVAFCLAALLLLGFIAYRIAYSTLATDPSGHLQIVDYTNIVVILLTTVTVLFTVAAIALGLAGIWGFRNIKEAAGEYARQSVSREIGNAFEPGGAAYEEIRREFQNDYAPLNRWLRHQIRREVTESLAFYRPGLDVDESDPTDEGDVS